MNFLDPFGLSRRSDNADLHDFYKIVGLTCLAIGIVATGVGIFAAGSLIGAAAISTAEIAGGVALGSTLVDRHYYYEEYKDSTSKEEKKVSMHNLQKANFSALLSIIFMGTNCKLNVKVKGASPMTEFLAKTLKSIIDEIILQGI